MSHSLMKYHPRIGYHYMPSSKLRVQWGNGGYLVRTNAAGFRSDTEFVQERKPGTFRAIVFGDSQTAGDGVVNAQRYTDLLEKTVPNLEVFNYSISGTGPDQQFLAYQEHAGVEHDLLIIALYVENIRRVTSRVVKSNDASGEETFRLKPYYRVENDELVLHNVPVPKATFTEATLPEELIPYCYPPYSVQKGQSTLTKKLTKNVSSLLRSAVPMAGLRMAVKKAAMRLDKFRPVPDFDSAESPGWLVLRRILEDWISASRTPVLVIPLPHYYFFDAPADAAGYQARFRELAEKTRCHLYDPLPDLLKLSAEDRGVLWSDSSGHISIRGSQLLADVFAPVIQGIIRTTPATHAS
jgi:hypothetical protein